MITKSQADVLCSTMAVIAAINADDANPPDEENSLLVQHQIYMACKKDFRTQMDLLRFVAPDPHKKSKRSGANEPKIPPEDEAPEEPT